MRKHVFNIMTSFLLKKLEDAPKMTASEAMEIVKKKAKDSDLFAVNSEIVQEYLGTVSQELKQGAVIDPFWLRSEKQMGFHFFPIEADAGFYPQIERVVEQFKGNVSTYVLYGTWDFLIMYCGSEAGFDSLRDNLNSEYSTCQPFSARRVLYYHRYPVDDSNNSCHPRKKIDVSDEVLNKLVADYAAAEFETERNALEEARTILGPRWYLDSETKPRVSAFVGINFRRARQRIDSSRVLAALLEQPGLSESLVHLFELKAGQPYHLLAKLETFNMKELDKSTNEISSVRVEGVGLEGVTLITARDNENLATVTDERISAAYVDIAGLGASVITEYLSRLDSAAIGVFNGMEEFQKLEMVRSLVELDSQKNERAWDEERDRRIRGGIDSFARAFTNPESQGVVTGPVMEIMAAFEGYLKHALRRIADVVYGGDYRRAQKEFHLDKKDFRDISLGNTVKAVGVIQTHPDFEYLAPVLEADLLDRLKACVNIRNKWAHDRVNQSLSRMRIVDEARRDMVEGIELIRWIGGSLLPAVMDRNNSSKGGEDIELVVEDNLDSPEIFISYSFKDEAEATKLANRLMAFDYKVNCASLFIQPGDSIVDKINEHLNKSDIVLVLLSKDSVESSWVKREMNTSLMRQLAGADVRIIPILLSACKIPPVFQEILYVDMTRGIQDGFKKLIDFLENHRR